MMGSKNNHHEHKSQLNFYQQQQEQKHKHHHRHHLNHHYKQQQQLYPKLHTLELSLTLYLVLLLQLTATSLSSSSSRMIHSCLAANSNPKIDKPISNSNDDEQHNNQLAATAPSTGSSSWRLVTNVGFNKEIGGSAAYQDDANESKDKYEKLLISKRSIARNQAHKGNDDKSGGGGGQVEWFSLDSTGLGDIEGSESLKKMNKRSEGQPSNNHLSPYNRLLVRRQLLLNNNNNNLENGSLQKRQQQQHHYHQQQKRRSMSPPPPTSPQQLSYLQDLLGSLELNQLGDEEEQEEKTSPISVGFTRSFPHGDLMVRVDKQRQQNKNSNNNNNNNNRRASEMLMRNSRAQTQSVGMNSIAEDDGSTAVGSSVAPIMNFKRHNQPRLKQRRLYALQLISPSPSTSSSSSSSPLSSMPPISPSPSTFSTNSILTATSRNNFNHQLTKNDPITVERRMAEVLMEEDEEKKESMEESEANGTPIQQESYQQQHQQQNEANDRENDNNNNKLERKTGKEILTRNQAAQDIEQELLEQAGEQPIQDQYSDSSLGEFGSKLSLLTTRKIEPDGVVYANINNQQALLPTADGDVVSPATQLLITHQDKWEPVLDNGDQLEDSIVPLPSQVLIDSPQSVIQYNQTDMGRQITPNSILLLNKFDSNYLPRVARNFM